MEDGKVLLPIVSNKRECGDCTKCCEGYTSGAAYEHKFGNIDGVRVPCFFVEQGVGCKIYADRPISPCQTYKCEWLANPDVPEEFKPNKVDVIVSRKGRSYFVTTDAGDNPQDKVKEWWIEYTKSKNFNLSYRINGELHFSGNERLRQTLGYSQKDLDPNEIPRQERIADKERKVIKYDQITFDE